MQHMCHGVDVVRYEGFDPMGWRALAGFFSTYPRSVVATFNRDMANRVQEVMRGETFDLILASELGSAPYVARVEGIPKVLEDVELGLFWEQFLRQTRFLPRMRYGLTWWKTCRYVRRLLGAFRGCTVVSEQDRLLLKKVCQGRQQIALVSNGVDLTQSEEVDKEENTLIFPGALTYDSNLDAMRFFLSRIYPLIQYQVPDVSLRITGRTEGVDTSRLAVGPGVVFTGYVDEIRSWVTKSMVCVVPLRKGSGTRLKVLEAMACGTAVVSTNKGAEGLHVEDKEHLLIEDDPESFAAAVVRLLRDPSLRQRMAGQARGLVEKEYVWKKSVKVLNELLISCVAQGEGEAS